MKRLCAVALLFSIEKAALAAPCIDPLDPVGAVRCALAQSPDVRIAREGLRALEGRRIAAGIFLPSNPTISFSAAGRTASSADAGLAGQTFFNWTATLSQEVEIAGQRRARIASVDAETAAQRKRLIVAEQEVAAATLVAYYDLAAARDALALANDVARVADGLAAAAQVRLEHALISPVDADLARAEALRMGVVRFEAERRMAAAQAELATLLGRSPSEPVQIVAAAPPTSPPPPIDDLIAGALELRGEVAASQIERQVDEHRLALLRRARVPNPTLSFFAERDGFGERVLGGSVSLPIPLPSPVGRTNRGEIVETQARIEQDRIGVERVKRQVRLEVADAWTNLRARNQALAAFSPDFVARLRRDLGVLSDGLRAGQLSVREALLAERTLIETLQAHLEARLSYARAWIELRRASGRGLPGVSP